jgi:hypothetical protein
MLPDFDRADRREVGGDARNSGVGLRFLLELSKIERQAECAGDIARG